MNYVKITVLKKDYNKNLVLQYGVDGLKQYPMLHEGQEIICKRHNQPKEICEEAWKSMQHYALYHGSDIPFGNKWMKYPGIAIVTCNDGLRPVTFKLELIQDEGDEL